MIKKNENPDYRPEYHFTPPGMWMNDPNGLVYIDGIYHLFYQHYPDDTLHGPMHWGHAISRNLLDWEHLPIALYPDDSGYIFSGSCIYDRDNISGLGKDGKGPLIALYTSHDPRDHGETQCIAYSTDFVNFEKYPGNPVIPNPGLRDFRDPKAFWNPVKRCWSLVLAADRSVFFYSTSDLKHWTLTGEFSTRENGLTGICECPDCLPVETEEGTKWVLIISMILGSEDGKAPSWKTQYFVGDFDGDTFLNEGNREEVLLLGHGFDHYAGVTFNNAPKPVLIAWADNWAYAKEAPTGNYRGQMSLPCEVGLEKTEAGYRVRLSPLGPEPGKREPIPRNGELSTDSRTYGLETEGCGSIILSNGLGEKLLISLSEDEVRVDRTQADRKDFSENYGNRKYGIAAAKRSPRREGRLKVFYDHSLLEIFADGGLVSLSLSVYPGEPYDTLTVNGDLRGDLLRF